MKIAQYKQMMKHITRPSDKKAEFEKALDNVQKKPVKFKPIVMQTPNYLDVKPVQVYQPIQRSPQEIAFERWLDDETKRIELARSTRKGGITDLI